MAAAFPGAFYDGAIYARLVEPTTRGIHRLVARAIPPDTTLIDGCCGTGGLARELSPTLRHVVGIDLSLRMIDYARSVARTYPNVDFRVGNLARLDQVGDATFDWGTIVMGLHEMPGQIRLPALREMARVAEKLLLVDFAPRLAWNRAGIRNRFFELAAGRRHFGRFRDFAREGGLPALSSKANLDVIEHRRIDSGTLDFCILASKTAGQ